jgi:hypothetical protein
MRSLQRGIKLGLKVAFARMAIGSGVFISLALSQCVKAEEVQLQACMAKLQQELQISRDLAFTECNKKTLADCLKSMTGEKYVARSVSKKITGT